MIITPFHKPIHRTSLFSRLGVSCLLVACATSCACQDPRPKERDSNDHEVAEVALVQECILPQRKPLIKQLQ